MAPLTIDLQDGFANDAVIVRVDGQEVFHRDDVTTSPLSGLAESIATQVSEGPVTIDVTLPARGIAQAIALSVSGPIYLGVAVRGDRVEHRLSADPFYYM